jgi:hypothetical protein
MSLIVGMDFIDNSGTYGPTAKKGADGAFFVKALALSGTAADTPTLIQQDASVLAATALAASIRGTVGVPEAAVATGSVGWYQIRGRRDNVQGAAGSFTGSVGHAVYWAGATGLGANSSANSGLASNVGVLIEGVSSSTTANIYLFGNFTTPSL